MTDDQQLIKIIEDGAEQERDRAFSKLFRKYKDEIFVYIKKSVSDKRDADEILIDTFNKTYHKLISKTWEVGNLRAYLYRVAKTTLLNHLTRKSFKRNLKTSHVGEITNEKQNSPEIDAFYNEEHNKYVVKKLIEKLPLKQQKTLELNNLGYSHKEIAEKVGWANAQTSRNQLSIIRRALIDKLKKINIDKLL